MLCYNIRKILLVGNKKESTIYPIGSLPSKNSYFCDEGYGLMLTNRAGTLNLKQQNVPKISSRVRVYNNI